VSLLEIKGLEVRYGGIRAVKGVDLAVNEGELVCLIGANGAGKTSTLKAICGMLPAAAGAVSYAGKAITGMPSFRLVREGLVLVPEGRGIFGQLTVAENLSMGAFARNDPAGVKRDLEKMLALFPRLAERSTQSAGTLSGGEQQMLALGRALMSKPRLLVLDEPSMGLAPLMVRKIFEVVRRIAAEGVTILLVEQNARLALEAAGRGYVMESGAITLAGGAHELLADPRVREAYLGEEAAQGDVPVPIHRLTGTRLQ
jgi:branched-chain amino acid transport system ATP-binding protein